MNSGQERAAALKFVVLMGVISLLADMTYEGARSITGPFLASLGASAAVVGVVAGLGELIGYALRLLSGYLADRTGRPWRLALGGYAVNLLAVPLLALAGRWEIAAGLMIAERLGKAIRAPARDAMLSHAARRVGVGWGFGLHEALDQIGAVAGPLIVAAVVAARGGYRPGFAVLAIPAVLALGVLVAARVIFPRPRELEEEEPGQAAPLAAEPSREAVARRRTPWTKLPAEFRLYMGAVMLLAAGFVDFPLIAFHFARRELASPASIPLFYALAMGVDAVAALVCGRLFDRHGPRVLAIGAVATALSAPLVFLGDLPLALVGMALWGIGMGAQESIVRAAVATMIPAGRRAWAYGVFNAVFGVAWFLGSALMGVLYDVSLPALILFSVLAQLAAVAMLTRPAGRRLP